MDEGLQTCSLAPEGAIELRSRTSGDTSGRARSQFKRWEREGVKAREREHLHQSRLRCARAQRGAGVERAGRLGTLRPSSLNEFK